MVKGLAGEERASDSLSSAVHCEDDLDHINISERSVIAGRHNSSSSIATDGNSSSDSTESTAYSPMLVALREFMLAMLIYVSTFDYNAVRTCSTDFSDMIIFVRRHPLLSRYAKRY